MDFRDYGLYVHLLKICFIYLNARVTKKRRERVRERREQESEKKTVY